MPVAAGIDASTAFERQLRTLCLNEFPCGQGSWRTSNDKSLPASRFHVTLKDYGSSNEQEETLEELISSPFSPYSVDYSWSSEAKQLRDLAVKSPWLINKEFILGHFKSLRIVDKNVSKVDDGLLRLSNLEELTLSVNKLKTVDTCNVPSSLKVLELVANHISDLEPLCNKPPPTLHHLGLGLNRISALHDYITGTYWPSLLSLDLSHNDLCDLVEVVQTLATLPKLRNLVLVGNPLALIPGYRGFIIDSLRSLSILDDLGISADEKHHFKGLARKLEFILDEAKVTVKIGMVTGVPMPPELQATEEQPEFPIITRTYYVEYMFLEDFKARACSAQQRDASLALTEKENVDTEKEDVQAPEIVVGKQEGITSDQDGPVPEGTFFTQTDESPSKLQPPPSTTNGTDHSQSPPPPLKLVQYRTEGLQWAEEGLEFAWEHELVIDDLPALKEFFKRGMLIAVKEDKVLSVPAEEGDEKASEAGKKAGGQKSAKTGKDSKSEKADKPKEKPGGGKKKKKEPEIELIHSPPEVTVLGMYTVDLGSFVDGDYSLEETCTCQGGALDAGEEEEEDKKDDSLDSKKDKKKKKEGGDNAKAKKGKDSKDKDKDKGKKTGKPDKKDSKMKRPESQLSDEDDRQAPPPPLNVHIQVELHHWLTARDSIPKPPVVKQPEDDGKSEAGTQG
ncbi:leucine-rich repeat-containing protein 43-like isoform X2 [Acanthaster planci]|uniref:Leucine-rich repeat-containing protein 43-like isoform X2 n=1 Tax=Acanthaster planci TaxID=133434 RepID=A0A8B7Y1P2_ACAPL|nr:leucine-rich repeat-containing protein 43-like isoform X2 [Acanthaster planci]